MAVNDPAARDLALDDPASESGSFIRELRPEPSGEVSLPPLTSPRLPADVESSPAARRAADTIVEVLVEAGVDTFFGIPGGPISPIFDAILCCPRARLIESRHESGAAFAAAGYYRATGRVPCVVVTAGPGATNAVTGVVSAHCERVPMLVICGDVAWSAEGGRLLQDSGPEGIDIESMLRSVTRAQIRVVQAKSASAHALAALRAATHPETPGPALLVVPIHRGAASARSPRVVAEVSTASTRASPELVKLIAEKLCVAERPLLVLGAGARPHAPTLARLLDILDIPFVTTPRAKGLLSERHPRSLRHGGLAASRWARAYTERGVDVALVLGTDLDDCSVGATRYVREGGELIHVDLDARVFNRNLPTALGVVADIGSFAEEMLRVVQRLGLLHGRIGVEVRALRRESAFDVPGFRSDEATIISPYRALADLEGAAGRGARFVTDIGEHMLFALHYLTAGSPDQFLINLGLGSMGSGICSAVGLGLGDPARRVICVCGDGGMQMAGMEALVAVQERLNIVFAVFNDARYNMVYHGHRQVFGRDVPWETSWIDFAGWAQALQIPAARINHPGEINGRLLDALTANGPALLDIRVDRHLRLAEGGRNEALLRMSMLDSMSSEAGESVVVKARVSGLGQWLPPDVRENEDFPAEFRARSRASDSRELVEVDPEKFCLADRIALRYFQKEADDPFLGTTRRRVAAKDVTAPWAEAEAARAALDDAQLSPAEIDVVVSWAAVPERLVPPSAPAVAHLIGATNAYAIGMDAACATPIAQLELATALIETGRARHVLLTQSHLITRTFPLLHPAAPNVGDAATAFVVSASEAPGVLFTFLRTRGEYYDAVTWCRGKDAEPPWWEAGPAYYLGSKNRAQAQELVRATVRIGAETVLETLERARIPLESMSVLACVQPRAWIPAAIAEAVGGDLYAPHTFDELAHLGGCGVVTNLLRARSAGALGPGIGSILYAQGAGFTRAAALICW